MMGKRYRRTFKGGSRTNTIEENGVHLVGSNEFQFYVSGQERDDHNSKFSINGVKLYVFVCRTTKPICEWSRPVVIRSIFPGRKLTNIKELVHLQPNKKKTKKSDKNELTMHRLTFLQRLSFEALIYLDSSLTFRLTKGSAPIYPPRLLIFLLVKESLAVHKTLLSLEDCIDSNEASSCWNGLSFCPPCWSTQKLSNYQRKKSSWWANMKRDGMLEDAWHKSRIWAAFLSKVKMNHCCPLIHTKKINADLRSATMQVPNINLWMFQSL